MSVSGDSGPSDDRWLAVTLPAPAPGEAILLVEALRRLGARTVEREVERVLEWTGREGHPAGERRLLALFPEPADPEGLVADIVVAVRASTSLGTVTPRWRWLEHDEWVARWGGGHPARRVSDRLAIVVGESGAARGLDGVDRAIGGYAANPGGQVIRLEPSSAFGTAEHPTTRACLRMLDGIVRDGDRVLDIGSGSGVLSIAAVLLGAVSAMALEADPVACAAARRNAALNGVSDPIEVLEVEVRPGSLRDRSPFDGIVANIGAEVLRPLLPDLVAALATHGWLILSGVTPRERDDLVASARGVGLAVAGADVLEGWWTGRFERVFGATRGGS